MEWLAAFCLLGIPAAFLLLWRVPLCRSRFMGGNEAVSLIVPARNEEKNLPHLLQSIRASAVQPNEVLVIDDASTDGTARVAEAHGATVLHAPPLQHGWTGKNWSCSYGAEEASADVMLFLDADTWFASDGFQHIAGVYSAAGDGTTALSILPYHEVQRPYEELSLFFNLLMAMGAGGFGALGPPRLFGQSLLISRDLYNASGGHRSVSKRILENLALSSRLSKFGGRCVCFGGRGVLNVRMFPQGLSQLSEGWTKAFADGAATSGPAVLAVSIIWLTALCTCFLAVIMAPGIWRARFAVIYGALALQLFHQARQIGSFRLLTCLLYPIPLFFYFAVFAQSLYRKLFKRKVVWRGRAL